MPRNGTKNLKPYGVLTKEEQKKLTSMGGKASVEARRRQKTLREMFETFGESKPNKVVVEQFEKLGIPVDDDDTMLSCMFKWAGVKSFSRNTKVGDLVKFFEVFGKYTDQEPAQKVESTIKYITPESVDEIKQHIKEYING